MDGAIKLEKGHKLNLLVENWGEKAWYFGLLDLSTTEKLNPKNIIFVAIISMSKLWCIDSAI